MNSAEHYAKHGTVHHKYVSEIYNWLLQEKLITWNKNEKILDIGSGAGRILFDVLLPKLPADIAKVVASDISEEMVEYCRRKQMTRGEYSSIRFDIQAKHIPVELEYQFDHLFSTYCFMYVHNIRQAVSNCFTLLKPGGKLIFIFAIHNVVSEIHKLMCDDAKWLPYLGHRKDYVPLFYNTTNSTEKISKHFEANGFIVEFCEIDHDVKLMYETAKDLQKIFQLSDTEECKLPLVAIESYRQDFMESMLSLELITTGTDGSVTLKFPTVTIVAKKTSP